MSFKIASSNSCSCQYYRWNHLICYHHN
ncbi:hypothetical protein HBE96_02080 [Clostridium sp. P21]|uniref:Uncharacterized protein n=1 Tax=Clostridium muellerianum TaxID=2716538 RepID=A0A7Y0EDR5_9CLOT|nr:hypothetical protein [Clostridium muellerianum]